MTILTPPWHQDINIDVCAGILPNGLTGAVYHRYLVNELPVLLEHVPLHKRQRMWFMHNGAPPPHFLRTVRQHLNQAFGEQWTGRGGPVGPGLVMWDLWWTKWRWGRFSPSTSVSPANLHSTNLNGPVFRLAP
jgi:hypothetical protein